MAVWVNEAGGNSDTFHAVVARVFHANGSFGGKEFRINTATAGFQLEPRVTTLADGRVVATWTGDSATGDDTLAGDTGHDRLTGNLGEDVFVFGPRDGRDRVTDFATGDDRIDVPGFDFASFAVAKSHFFVQGQDLVFALGSQSLTLIGAAALEIQAADLIL